MLIKAFGQDDPRPWETINHYPGTDADAYKGVRHIVGNILIIQKNFFIPDFLLCQPRIKRTMV